MAIPLSEVLSKVVVCEAFSIEERREALEILVGATQPMLPVQSLNKIDILNASILPMQTLVATRQRVAAIKLYRAITGASLRDSFDYIRRLPKLKGFSSD